MNDLEKAQEKLDELDNKIKKTLASKLKEWANNIKQQIQQRTKDGLGVSDNGKGEKALKPLKSQTIERRKTLKSQGLLSSDTQPEFSNQIETGEMVNNMQVSVNTNKLEIEITPPNTRKEAAKGQRDKGRAIFNVSDEQLKELENDIKE